MLAQRACEAKGIVICAGDARCMHAIQDDPAKRVRSGKRETMLRAYLNYWLVASVVVWAAIIGVMAYRLNESPWRWAFVALVFCGGLTIAVIFWIKKYVDRLNEAEEKQESKL